MKPPRIARMSPPYLASGLARCDGIYNDFDQKWRDGCEQCLRRIAARNHPFYVLDTPSLTGEKCEFLILQKK